MRRLYKKSIFRKKKVCVITDSNVAPLYLDRVVSDLEKKRAMRFFSFIFKAGELKTTAVIVEMVEFLAEKGLTRKDLVVALGGGVCGDMAGFAAAIYLRGIDFVDSDNSAFLRWIHRLAEKQVLICRRARIFAVRFISPYWCLLIRWLCTRFPIITSVMEWVRLLRQAVSSRHSF